MTHLDRRAARPILVAFAVLALAIGSATPAMADDPSPSPSAAPSAAPAPSAASSPVPAPTLEPAPSPEPALAGPIAFLGRGRGHGVGMSQYGALGRALAGQDFSTILAHYYPGTTLATADPARIVRVLIVAAHQPTRARPVRVAGRHGPWRIDGIAKTFPAGATATLAPSQIATGSTVWSLRVRALDGSVLHAAPAPAGLRLRPSDDATRFRVAFKPISPDTYRGVIRLVTRPTGTVLAVNEVALEDYLRGVVAVEMPSTWPAEALKAQAIAARGYALRHLRPGVGTFDVYDDTRSQVYRGVRAERPTTNAAVLATAGQVLVDGTGIADTVFHSTAGGATEHNENVWASPSGVIVATPVTYLRGSPDVAPDGTPYDAGSPYATWQTASYTGEALSAILAMDPRTAVGTLKALDLSNRGVSGRIIRVTLTGSTGAKTVSGETFRAVFNRYSPLTDPAIRSTLFDLAPTP